MERKGLPLLASQWGMPGPGDGDHRVAQTPGTAAWDSSATAEPAYPASSRPAQVLRPWGAGWRVAHTRENQRMKANRMEARAKLWELPREPGEGRGGKPLFPFGLLF